MLSAEQALKTLAKLTLPRKGIEATIPHALGQPYPSTPRGDSIQCKALLKARGFNPIFLMNVAIRRAQPSDIDVCARINYEVFKDISDRHHFHTDFQTLEFSTEIIDLAIESPLCFGIVAEREGAVVGCGFMDERNPIRGIGPVAVDRTFQGRRHGTGNHESFAGTGTGRSGHPFASGILSGNWV